VGFGCFHELFVWQPACRLLAQHLSDWCRLLQQSPTCRTVTLACLLLGLCFMFLWVLPTSGFCGSRHQHCCCIDCPVAASTVHRARTGAS
jgi:hypothetical protein